MNAQPRLRGRVGLGEDNKPYFEITMWTLDGETQVGAPLTYGPWANEIEARDQMKIAMQIACEACEDVTGTTRSGKYLDMKNGGILRPWKEQ